MPFANRHSAGTIWLPTGNPDTTNISPTDLASQGGRLGAIGVQFEAANPARSYQRVIVDSGATAATPAGIVAVGDLMYWRDKSTYTVTNDSRFAMAGASNTAYRNYVAGIAMVAGTAGYAIDVCQRGQSIPCADGGNTFAAGEHVFPEATTTDSAVDRVAAGTACPDQQLGTARGAAAGGLVNVDIDILAAQ